MKEMIPQRKAKVNPNAFIAIGVCYMGAGVTLGIALQSKGTFGSWIGLGLIGVGVVFLVMGALQKRKSNSQ
jgi:hypothetical protein